MQTKQACSICGGNLESFIQNADYIYKHSTNKFWAKRRLRFRMKKSTFLVNSKKKRWASHDMKKKAKKKKAKEKKKKKKAKKKMKAMLK